MTPLQQTIWNMIKCFRRNWRLFSDSERTTVCGADCMLMALHLSVAEINKKLCGEFQASLSEVILSWNYFVPDKLGILPENAKAPENYADIRNTYASFLKHCNMMDLVDIYIKCETLGLQIEPIPSVQLLEFIAGTADLTTENNSSNSAVSTPKRKINHDKEELPLMVKKTLFAYLILLVNSKNDLAFAHILNIPDRGLGREAFTDLKHAAQKKQMSIFPMATSFIRAIELGGKGYAPLPTDPLRTHVKGLSQFIHFTDKLEEIIGEDLDPSHAGGRILSTIKMQLIKGLNSGDPFCQAAEEVVQDLDLRIKSIISFQHEAVAASATGISPARPKQHCINHDTVYCGRDTVKSLLAVLDEAASHPPFSNKALLLFGCEEFGFPSTMLLFKSPTQSSGSSPKALRQRIQMAACEKIKLKQPLIRSQFACTYKDDQIIKPKNQPFSLSPVLTNVYPALQKTADSPTEDRSTSENLTSSFENTTLGTGSGSVCQNGRTRKEIGKLNCQPEKKNPKRKLVDRTNENVIVINENETPQHIYHKKPKTAVKCQNSLDSKLKETRKSKKSIPKNKLITGQAKLTQFFRL
ncbi:PCNA-interacting partner isoform X1 [Pantherophis guttatus]|uniref:PCNA-interacting partner n=1 Tax=Pantherophis guttatus TaxID=94885 RepID=A0A6P9AMA6_PANGU|nr:PCNA-interacting partner isoform X1 [Pantherophis guttatus]XP_034259710.1 PCNA-interacting partner isoform X1 [Pantherophis guttatus]XP_034259712.1 PCNA-interacting partner isoform X1 [Pantherophis guttatus]XP_034259713.1 PCNA-interacting partner isoform X1 [Pantherophis guttatus]XP_034259714.1 PCNA-interacting partner isoform X1 [Pantherophis guttatus]XP_034259715.1 PCNA-interacting partner isoform X1 [Pantherophis guttatus]XP_034259716.1 PCNA-interacting partner isoform X1 [Pantherophis 